MYQRMTPDQIAATAINFAEARHAWMRTGTYGRDERTDRQEWRIIWCANELIRRAIDRECNTSALQGFSCWPHEVARVHARNIIVLRTWELTLS